MQSELIEEDDTASNYEIYEKRFMQQRKFFLHSLWGSRIVWVNDVGVWVRDVNGPKVFLWEDLK